MIDIKCCFDCVHQNIIETSHEWIECFCKVDGRSHSPYRPNCNNYEKIIYEEKTEVNNE